MRVKKNSCLILKWKVGSSPKGQSRPLVTTCSKIVACRVRSRWLTPRLAALLMHHGAKTASNHGLCVIPAFQEQGMLARPCSRARIKGCQEKHLPGLGLSWELEVGIPLGEGES